MVFFYGFLDLPQGKNFNHFFHNNNSLMYINYCEVCEMAMQFRAVYYLSGPEQDCHFWQATANYSFTATWLE